MKAIYFNLLLILVFPALVLANPVHDKNWKGKYTKEKKINKEFSVTSDALLNISNDYGNIDITTWEENRVVIQVIIKTNGDDEQKVREKLNDITVNFEASSSYVTAKTKIDKNVKIQQKVWFIKMKVKVGGVAGLAATIATV